MVRNLSAVLLIFLVACSGSASDEAHEATKFELTEGQDAILVPYFEMVKALQQDDFNKARDLGKILSTAEQDTGVKLALTRMGTLMNQSASTFDQRTILEQMGMVITLYIEQEIINNYPIYKFTCKNEFDGKEVVWFDLSEDSKNPFIGENSSECVDLVETIEPVLNK